MTQDAPAKKQSISPNPSNDPLHQSLLESSKYLSGAQQLAVIDAYHYAAQAHEGQYRRSGEPYITHPVAVANILADMRMDAASLMAALLHDVIEDCGVAKSEIAERFSPVVADLVDGVSKIGAIQFESRAIAQAENFRKMVLAMTQDIRVILVKLADRLHNMRTLSVLNGEKRRRIATETLEIYAPIANRLGMNNIRVEFEDLGFFALHPMRAKRIRQAVKRARGNRKEIMSTLNKALSDLLDSEKIPHRSISREKHLYSIYQKMKHQRKPFNEIMDVYGFRLIVSNIDECYRTLGLVHNLYKPVPGRFKDYIAIPKANGYQSLHTTLIGLGGVPIEIQIRTEEMESLANNGIAAHWLYKSKEEPSLGAQGRAREWLKGLLELQQNAGSSLEFIENVKIDLFPDEIYVFTPKGDIMDLPNGATPIDFAYAVHTAIGNTCVAARIDHRLAPLSTPLNSGQTVEVITAPGSCPNAGWLSFAVTSKARSNIRHFLKNQRRSESIQLGKRLLEKSLIAFGHSLKQVSDETKAKVTIESGLDDFECLLEDIGLGNRMAPLVGRKLLPSTPIESSDAIASSNESQRPLVISGTEGMVVKFAKCCHPIPGDPIVAFLSSGRGMVVHADTCRNFGHELKQSPEKCLPVNWDNSANGDFPAHIRVEIENKRGVLAALANTIAECDANIETIHMGEKDSQISLVNMTIGVKNRVHLARIIKRLRLNKAVIKILRLKG
jgi:guanosine-3',5'-bis(diphosphate) 3'-pyrophosphohydrolase